jgi:hypothetical protein
MAEDGLLHTAELLKTILPHVDVRSKLTLDLLVKLYELMICMRNYRTNDITACGFEDKNEKADMETLLNNIRPKCAENERSFVDKMLNIFQAKRMFEMYNTYSEAMKGMQGFEGFEGFGGFGGFGGNDSSKGDANSDDYTDLMNNFKDFDFSSILNNNSFNADTLSELFNDMSAESRNEDNENNLTDEYNTYTDENSSDENSSDENKTNENSTEKPKDYNWTPDNDIIYETNDDSISSNDNNNMFESLKAMIPPEQMRTFENLRMLFGSMSYDDNNKSYEKKE